MNRRQWLEGSAALIGSAFTLVHWPLRATPALGTQGSLAKVAASASKCIEIGLACVKHCEEQLASGNKDMAACLSSVQDMLAACEALHKLAVRGSKHVTAVAKACIEVCADCAKACEPHRKMAVCGDCYDRCRECEAACKEIVT